MCLHRINIDMAGESTEKDACEGKTADAWFEKQG